MGAARGESASRSSSNEGKERSALASSPARESRRDRRSRSRHRAGPTRRGGKEATLSSRDGAARCLRRAQAVGSSRIVAQRPDRRPGPDPERSHEAHGPGAVRLREEEPQLAADPVSRDRVEGVRSARPSRSSARVRDRSGTRAGWRSGPRGMPASGRPAARPRAASAWSGARGPARPPKGSIRTGRRCGAIRSAIALIVKSRRARSRSSGAAATRGSAPGAS